MLRRFALALFFCTVALLGQDTPPQEAAPDPKSLLDAGNLLYLKGDYAAAGQTYQQAWDALQQTPPENPMRYDALKRMVSVRAAAGQFKEANDFLQTAINWREQILGPADPIITDDLLQSVGLFRGMKDYGQALVVLNRVLSMHVRAGSFESILVADDYSRMAQIYLEQQKAEDAISPLNTSIAIRTRLGGPLDPGMVYDLDRLGAVQTTLRAYDQAENAYRHALVIRESLFGKIHADLIADVDGLAYALFGEKKFDDAEPVYLRLLGLWAASVGEDHPMVAVALDKVAVFYIEQKKFDKAKEMADQANAIRAKFLAEGLSEQATEQFAEGNKEETVALYKRAVQALEPPNPLYDKLHKELSDMLDAVNLLTPKSLTKKAPATTAKKKQ
ncbi:MAG TPA: tetratricopeptide repeat protein [Candidatus Sulfopaludibacter sp.]|jgi:tetratricopeptide (TPR) repeat protein|nr:tetratricopeptide repeat protein [Candidatus Sulfopaludibacter sp.]